MEREEGDPQRQVHRLEGQSGHAKDRQQQIELIDEEIGILECDQQSEVDDDGQETTSRNDTPSERP